MSDLEVFEVSLTDALETEDGEVGDAVTVPVRLVDTDGEELETRHITFNPPDSAQAALITMKLSFGGKRKFEEVLSLMGMIVGLIDDQEDRDWIYENLADRSSPLTLESFTMLLERVVQGWYARPTEGPQGSSRSPRTTGPKSTARQPRKASTRSATSRRTGS